jgi:hypothetical protein
MSTPAARAHEDDAVLALVRAAPLVEGEAEGFAEGLADIKAGRVASAEAVRGRLKQSADE